VFCSEETSQESKLEFSEDEETLIIRMFNLVGERFVCFPFVFSIFNDFVSLQIQNI
jgi:hypothetical protein